MGKHLVQIQASQLQKNQERVKFNTIEQQETSPLDASVSVCVWYYNN